MNDHAGALCKHDHPRRAGRNGGPLSGLTFAAKDIIAVRGVRSCYGNPSWLDSHEPATEDARAVSLLLDAGASLDGIALTDELALSLTGENAHYGTPLNSLAPDRVPGGSSSGSASAVAARLVDFSLGTDTGGSVRVPASHCGLYGMRPTLDAVSTRGVLPLATGLDTVGWFARDAALLSRVGRVLLEPRDAAGRPFERLLVLEDLRAVTDEAAWATFTETAARIAHAAGLPLESIRVGAGAPGLERWLPTYAAIQNAAILREHRTFLETEPRFGSLIGRRIQAIRRATYRAGEAEAARTALRAWLTSLANGACLLLPSAPGAAPPRGQDDGTVDLYTGRGLTLTSLASLCGAPQISLPFCSAEDCPFGLSILASPGSDIALLELAERLGERFHVPSGGSS